VTSDIVRANSPLFSPACRHRRTSTRTRKRKFTVWSVVSTTGLARFVCAPLSRRRQAALQEAFEQPGQTKRNSAARGDTGSAEGVQHLDTPVGKPQTRPMEVPTRKALIEELGALRRRGVPSMTAIVWVLEKYDLTHIPDEPTSTGPTTSSHAAKRSTTRGRRRPPTTRRPSTSRSPRWLSRHKEDADICIPVRRSTPVKRVASA
jgi:hypothetical protein